MTELISRQGDVNMVGLNDLLGHKVLAKDGHKLGTVKNVQIDPEEFTVEGITIGHGLFHHDDFVGKDYIERFTDEAVILKINPVNELVGLKVVDSSGREVGSVKKVRRSTKANNITSLVIDRGVLNKDMVVTGRAIKEIGKTIMLSEEVYD